MKKSGTLTPFDPGEAKRIVSWVDNPEVMHWLAPQTPPPLTEQKVLGWQGYGVHPFLYRADDSDDWVGYGEINDLQRVYRGGWIGHFLVAPDCRGQGWGQAFLRDLTSYGFRELSYRKVCLLAFPENKGATQCYSRVGYRIDGFEERSFPPDRRIEQMVRMVIRPRQLSSRTRRRIF
jgi:RimJ/RimL family protein N-acetyltransferase